jgi:RimJ/RimL family protein N-acetyltransferase
VVTIRTLREDDRARIAAAIRSLDRESIYMRLFTYRRSLTEAGLDRVMRAGPDDLVLVVTVGEGAEEAVVASGRSVRTSATSAEVAFMVSQDYQGKGIARRLLERFVEAARANGLSQLEADVLGENRAMLAVFERSGLAMRRARDGNVVHVTLAL